jgi:hypothetical protein
MKANTSLEDLDTVTPEDTETDWNSETVPEVCRFWRGLFYGLLLSLLGWALILKMLI